jgi:hypothetical protein
MHDRTTQTPPARPKPVTRTVRWVPADALIRREEERLSPTPHRYSFLDGTTSNPFTGGGAAAGDQAACRAAVGSARCHRPADPDRRYVVCRCDCGQTKPVRIENLRRGRTRSCGCLHREYLAARKAATNARRAGGGA